MSASPDRWRAFQDERWDEPEGGGRSTLLLALTAISVFVAVGALALRQVTAPSTATRLLEAGIASTVDVDRYLADELPALQEWARLPGSTTTDLPGFPVEVIVTADEVEGDREVLRDAVLARSAAIVYADGTSAFDRTGNQTLDFASGESAIRLIVDRVNVVNHRRAGWVAAGAAAVLAVSAVLYAVRRGGRVRIRSLGGAAVVGTVPGVALAGLAHALAGQYGGTGDPYAAEVREVLRAAIGIPFRDYVISLGAGAAVIAIGVALELADRFLPQSGSPGTGTPE